jgi:glycerol uptake facilitator protein
MTTYIRSDTPIDHRVSITGEGMNYNTSPSIETIEPKSILKLAASEFFGTFLFVYIAIAGVNQTVLSSLSGGGGGAANQLQIGLCFAIGLASGVVVSKYSGGHLNPAISFAVWLFDSSFSTAQFITYVVSQVLGATCSGLLVLCVYTSWVELYPHESVVGMYGTFKNPNNSLFGSILDQIVGSFLLMFAIKLVPDSNIKPGVIGAILGGLALFQGSNGFAFNLARDLGPRFASTILFGTLPFTYINSWWWCPAFLSFFGCPLGYWFSQFFI